MKLHLPLNLLAALMTSFSGVTLGTATLAGVSGLLVTASQSYAADVAFDGFRYTHRTTSPFKLTH